MTRLAYAGVSLAVVAASAVPARADLTELKWATEGYFRTRTVLLTNLAAQDRRTAINPNGPDGDQTIVIPDIRRTSYITSRFRVMPTVAWGKLAKVTAQLDGFDDVLWGDNNGLSSAPLFATDTTNQGFLGGDPVDSIQLRRVWAEFNVPVGLMRVGRMPSHWGMGLLANGGGTGNIDPTTPAGEPTRRAQDYFFSEDMGEKHFGSTADRILFITRPITVFNTLAKKGVAAHPLIVGYAFDKLSEAPFLPYEPAERRFRPFGQQGFISRGSNDDVNEHVAIIVWNNPDWDKVRYTDELRVGTYIVLRTAKEGSTNPSAIDPSMTCGVFEGEAVPCVDTGSKVGIFDVWWRIRYGPYFTEGEAYQILGTTFGGVPFPIRNEKKKASINGAVARFAYLTDQWDAMLEVGHASGDDNLSDEKFTQRGLHPDFNVGLIMFEEILRELSARVYGIGFLSEQNPDGARGFFSNGGVINANYIYPKGKFRLPAFGLEAYGGVLVGFVDTLAVDGAAMFYDGDGTAGLGDTGGSKYLGTEVDAGARFNFAGGHMRFALETGYLRFGKALKSQLTNANGSFSLQTHLSFVW
jgi:hypothetical protein